MNTMSARSLRAKRSNLKPGLLRALRALAMTRNGALMSILFFETVLFAPAAFAEAEATAVSMAAAQEVKRAGEAQIKVSTALVGEGEFRLKAQAGKEVASEEKEAAAAEMTTEKQETVPVEQEKPAPAKVPTIVRTLKKVEGEVSWVGIKSMALNYQDEHGKHEYDSIFPFDKKLTLIGYNSILDIEPGDLVDLQYEEIAEDPGTTEESVSLSLKSLKRIRTGGQTES